MTKHGHFGDNLKERPYLHLALTGHSSICNRAGRDVVKIDVVRALDGQFVLLVKRPFSTDRKERRQ